MRIRFALSVAVCCLVASLVFCSAPVQGQDQPAVHPPQKYLYVSNESIKPRMVDSVIETETSKAQAARESNSPIHYLGMTSFTGAPRALFFAGFDSFADMRNEHGQETSDPRLQATIKADNTAEASMLAEFSGSIYKYRDDLSLNAALDISQMRFFDITLFHIHSGHYQDWEHLVKLYAKAYSSIPNSHWAMFEKLFGEDSDKTFILVTPIKSFAEEDQFMTDGDSLPKTVGEDQLQLMRELGSETVESSESDLFVISPQISYVPDAWLTASPDFWGKK
jgi:hypothetical protein